MDKVFVVFDIGKTNKKVLIFSEKLELIEQKEEVFPTIVDEDGFECDDIKKIQDWIKSSMQEFVAEGKFDIQGLNFSTYGATLVYIDSNGNLVTPVYNYLKSMPDGITSDIYSKFGGLNEFSRATASPALGMLNSGLQILWLKKSKPDFYDKVEHILHLPQYLSYVFTNKIVSEHTSIGCHTAMWNFDTMSYHPWLKDEGIELPSPVSHSKSFKVNVDGVEVRTGLGIHDSSASLVPYILGSKEKFILISTGTWSISMNPFNYEPLTANELSEDCLSYMSILSKPVKSSRLFMGYIHEVNAKEIAKYFAVPENSFKTVKLNIEVLKKLETANSGNKVFFKEGVSDNFIDSNIDFSAFKDYDEAYHQLMIDLTHLSIEKIKLIIGKDDETSAIYISGGFARNEIYVRLIATAFPKKKVYTSEIDNATALGAAMVLMDSEKLKHFSPDLGLKNWEAIK